MRRVSAAIVVLGLVTALRGAPAPTPAHVDVTVHEGTSMSVAVAPDGRTLAVDLQGSIWTLPASGGPATRITDIFNDARQPAFSPDGKWIAFFAYRDGGYDLWAIAPDGSNQHKLTWGAFDDGSCAQVLWVGIALSQGSCQLGIESVNVVSEMNVAVLIGERRPVDNEDRDSLHKIHGNVILFALHSLLYFFQGPAGIIPKYPRRQFGGLFHPDAAVAEITARARKEILGGRAMKIDVVLVGEYQFNQAQCIAGAGLLPDG